MAWLLTKYRRRDERGESVEHPGQAVGGGDALDAVMVRQHRRQVDEPGAHADGEHQTHTEDGAVAVAERHHQQYAAAQHLAEVRPAHKQRNVRQTYC